MDARLVRAARMSVVTAAPSGRESALSDVRLHPIQTSVPRPSLSTQQPHETVAVLDQFESAVPIRSQEPRKNVGIRFLHALSTRIV
eukprot:3933470-Rhodomonas_salina.4